VLTVLPGTLGRAETDRAAARRRGGGGHEDRPELPGRASGGQRRGRLEQAYYVERASAGPRQVIERAADVDPSSVPYMSLIIIAGAEAAEVTGPGSAGLPGEGVPGPGRVRRGGGSGRAAGTGLPRRRRRCWQRPTTLSATRLTWTGYRPKPGGAAGAGHGSDNRVEAQRAEFALDLALRGRRVAVVSSGDPGVFAMASVCLRRRRPMSGTRTYR